jgi:cysteine-rich repeat protein/YVTN family beta-propeller protein
VGLPLSVALTPNGRFAYVGNDGGYRDSQGAVSVFDTTTGALVATINLGVGAPWDIAITPNGAFAYASLGIRGYLPGYDPPESVVVIDTATNTVAATIPACAYPVGVAITPDGTEAYVANEDCGVMVIDTASNSIITTIPPGARYVAIAPDGSFAYVTTANVSIIDTASHSVTGTIAVAPNPDAIAIAPNGLYAYVSHRRSNSDLTVISTTTNAVVAEIQEPAPFLTPFLTLAVTPDGSYLMELFGGVWVYWMGWYPVLLQSAQILVYDIRSSPLGWLAGTFDIGGVLDAGDIASGRVGPCGNGVIDPGEECDDGNLINGDGCDWNCTVTRCGNGIVTAGEECDDGNQVNGDGCDNNCMRTGCGNGAVTAGEQCDDGNLVDGDGCDSNCTPTGCGNGVVTAGEECDDGGLINGDGCSADCTIEPGFSCTGQPSRCTRLLIPGQGKNACMLEWFTEEAATWVGRNGLPSRWLMCTDGDPQCDFGAATGDNACTFHVGVCLNVADTRLPCSPTDVARVQLLRPHEGKPKGATATANRDALETALTSIGGTVRGLCANKGPHNGQLCAVNSDCASTPGSRDGVCRGRFVVFTPPLNTDNSCTAFALIQVPLRQTTTRFKKASAELSVKAISDPGAGQKGHNSLKLTCFPHP